MAALVIPLDDDQFEFRGVDPQRAGKPPTVEEIQAALDALEPIELDPVVAYVVPRRGINALSALCETLNEDTLNGRSKLDPLHPIGWRSFGGLAIYVDERTDFFVPLRKSEEMPYLERGEIPSCYEDAGQDA